MSYLDQLLRWPFTAGETVGLVILAGAIIALCHVPPDHSHRSNEEN